MTTLHKIEELLNIEIGDKVLRKGRIQRALLRFSGMDQPKLVPLVAP